MRGRLALLRLDALRLHEQVSEPLVRRLMEELSSTGLQLDPIIVEEGGTVLDGAHRVEALRRMGARWAACYLVRYDAEDVKVGTWAWLLAEDPLARARELRLTKASVGEEALGRAYLLVREGELYVPEARAPDAISWRAQLVRAAELLLPHTCGYVTSQEAACRARIERMAYLEPRLPGKRAVLELASRQLLLPPKVTRHVVQGRPLDIRYPLRELMRESPRQLGPLSFRRLPPGSWFRGRFYEEEVLVAVGDDKGQGAGLP
ncbi:MAG: hypothetical protein C4339_05180 [Nitrososphaerota archaeon]